MRRPCIALALYPNVIKHMHLAQLPLPASSSNSWNQPARSVTLSTSSAASRMASASALLLSTSSDPPLERYGLSQTGGAAPNAAAASWGAKNLSLYWAGSAVLCVWFLFVHSPPFLVERRVLTTDAPLATHLAGAYTIYLSCLVNSLFTPSTRPGSVLHVWLGRVGMVSGLLSFVMGFYCAWLRPVVPPLGFSVGITVGGVAQIVAQVAGYRAIRRYGRYSRELEAMSESGPATPEKDAQRSDLQMKRDASLRTHIYNMVALFAVACGAPALLRVTRMILPEDMGVPGLVGSIVSLNLLVKPFGDTYLRNNADNTKVTKSQ